MKKSREEDTSTCFVAKYSIVWLYHILCIHSPTDGHLCCSYIFGFNNNAVMGTHVYVFVNTILSLESIIPEAQSNAVFEFK